MRASASAGGAFDAFAAGRVILLVDDGVSGGAGYLTVAAEHAWPKSVAFIVRHTSGFICVAMTESRADELRIPPMCWPDSRNAGASHSGGARPGYRVTVDAKENVSTGISAADRATTIRKLASPNARVGDLSLPGHVVPACAASGGLAARAGPTEALVELSTLVGVQPVAAFAEIVSKDDPTRMVRGHELLSFAVKHDVALLTIGSLTPRTCQRGGLAAIVASGESEWPDTHANQPDVSGSTQRTWERGF
ncbi:3,4-dihydroxy-2-butanone-4-phosphate synthase [Pseudonocardia sp. RS010]|uniref:3,4-dihydroxy-2-butanone-4-phosphate synthase n=1 Tax=Pseudonocardia sp. RS010 TaxID=3385979 RepID=UPI0039A06E54